MYARRAWLQLLSSFLLWRSLWFLQSQLLQWWHAWCLCVTHHFLVVTDTVRVLSSKKQLLQLASPDRLNFQLSPNNSSCKSHDICFDSPHPRLRVRITFLSPLPGEVHICLPRVKIWLLRPRELVLLQTALFEADYCSRTGARESVAVFASFVRGEKENIQWWRGSWLWSLLVTGNKNITQREWARGVIMSGQSLCYSPRSKGAGGV